MRYELVLLDLDDTVFDYAETEKYALKTLFHKYSITYTDSRRSSYSVINKALWDLYEKGGIETKELRTERFRKLLIYIGHSLKNIDLEKFSNDYLSYLSEEIFLEPYAKEIFSYLDSRYMVIFLTNGIHETQKRRLLKAGMLKNEDFLVSSEIAGSAKPDEKIVAYALDIAKIQDKDKVILIGDSMESDIKAANISGIASIWYNRRNRPKTHDFTADYEIASLFEIRGIL